MNNYKAVPSGMELSQRIADSLENAARREYQFGERVRALRAINDILQGRSARTADELLAELENMASISCRCFRISGISCGKRNC